MQEEVNSNRDVVILKGKDTYTNLPEKSFNLMRYFAKLPSVYTHLVKTDDDTWLRPDSLIKSLYETTPVDVMNELTDHQAMAVAMQTSIMDIQSFESARRKRKIPNQNNSLLELIKSHGIFQDSSSHDVGSNDVVIRNDTKIKKHLHSWLEVKASQVLVVDIPLPDIPRMNKIYMGCVENGHGFSVIRDSSSKWFLPEHAVEENDYPSGVLYAAGWGYCLSRDNVDQIVDTVDTYAAQGENSPPWFRKIPWEDVLVGILLANNGTKVEHNDGYKPAWTSVCDPRTIIKHLDIDSPRLLEDLVTQDRSGMTAGTTIQCSSFPTDDYSQWSEYKKLVATENS